MSALLVPSASWGLANKGGPCLLTHCLALWVDAVLEPSKSCQDRLVSMVTALPGEVEPECLRVQAARGPACVDV